MWRDELYELAFSLWRTPFWNKRRERLVFSVPCTTEEEAYCVIVGEKERFVRIELFHRELPEAGSQQNARSLFSAREAAGAKERVVCRYARWDHLTERDRRELRKYVPHPDPEQTYPCFREQGPYQKIWYLEKSVDRMRVALIAANQLAEQKECFYHRSAGSNLFLASLAERFSPGKDDVSLKAGSPHASFSARSRMDTVRLRRMTPHPGEVLLCDLLLSPFSAGGVPPFFPFVFLVMNSRAEILHHIWMQYPENQSGLWIADFLEYLMNAGKPEKIFVWKEHIYSYLVPLSRSCGFSIRLEESLEKRLSLLKAIAAFFVREKKARRRARWKMEEDETSFLGICLFCRKSCRKENLLRHLQICSGRPKEEGDRRYFILQVEKENRPECFLFLRVQADCSLWNLKKTICEVWEVEALYCDSTFCNGDNRFFCGGDPQDRCHLPLNCVAGEGDMLNYRSPYSSLRILLSGEELGAAEGLPVAVIAQHAVPSYRCCQCGAHC